VNLKLTDEEVITDTTNNCIQSNNRMPYGQMGSVDSATVCCCCHHVNGMSPGWGCDEAKVKEISQDLQERKVGRGNIAQLKNQENTMYNAIELDVRTDILMQHLDVAYPPTQESMVNMYGATPPTLPSDEAERGSGIHLRASEPVPTRSWDVTNYCELCCTCMSKSLQLDDEEFVLRANGPCCSHTVRQPYAQMGSVEKTDACCCCKNVSTDSTVISPQCGCAAPLVEEIGDQLQMRKVTRGNIAQIKQQENLIIELIKLGVKLDFTTQKINVATPPTQETMTRLFGEGAQVPPPASQSFTSGGSRGSFQKTTVEVVVPQGVSAGGQFQVQGPRGMFTAELPVGYAAGDRITLEVPSGTSSTPLLQATEMTSSFSEER